MTHSTFDPLPYVREDHYLALLHSNYVGYTATVVYRRDVLRSIKGFNVSIVSKPGGSKARSARLAFAGGGILGFFVKAINMSEHLYNIAHILPWSAVGGTEHATRRIAQAIEGNQFKNIAFCQNESTSVIDFFAEGGFETALYEPIELSLRRPQTFLRASLQLAGEFKRRKINLVHCSDVLAARFAAAAGRLAGLPILCHVRNRYENIGRFDRRGLRLVNKFAFVSQDTWRRFSFRVPSQRGVVVYDGIDADLQSDVIRATAKQDVRRELGIPDTAKIVGMVARIDPQKDYRTLARAARDVVAAEPNVRFVIVGGYSSREEHRAHYEEVKKMLAENKVADYFIFTDFRKDIPRLVNAMDIFVLSTHWEGLPLVILEAMAQGKPVIATAVDGIPEIIIDGKTGLLFSHQNNEQLAAQVLSLLHDEARATIIGRLARQFIKTNFSKEHFADSISDLYREMLGIDKGVVVSRAAVDSDRQFESN